MIAWPTHYVRDHHQHPEEACLQELLEEERNQALGLLFHRP
jgi:hypothetical protein